MESTESTLNLTMRPAYRPNAAVAIVYSNGCIAKLARVAMETGDSAAVNIVAMEGKDSTVTMATVASHLPAGCSNVTLVFRESRDEGGHPADIAAEQKLAVLLADKGIELLKLNAGRSALAGLAVCWFSGVDELQSGHQLWHPSPPSVNQQVTHSPTWRLINERLARRMRRREAASGGGATRRGTAIVAELGPHALTLDRIDLDDQGRPSSSRLATEPILGYRNLLGLARLSSVSLSTLPDAAESLAEFLALSAGGNLGKLDLTIGDLLPAESSYGLYDLGAVVFTLGKLHDLRSLGELQPSQSDIAASLSYAFIKTFFDTLVHSASGHGLAQIIVRGDFFESAACRSRLLEAWNFAGIPKDALELTFLRADCSDSLAMIGGLLQL